MIRNINENFGSDIIVANVAELETLIKECEHTIPECGLVDGRDYVVVESTVPETLHMISNSNGIFVTTSDVNAKKAEKNVEEVEEINFVGSFNNNNIYAIERTRKGSYNKILGYYVDLYSVSMYEHDASSGEANYIGDYENFGEYVFTEI